MQHYLFVGLGNPGIKYSSTRHNLGIRLLRSWYKNAKTSAQESQSWHQVNRFESEVATLTQDDTHVICLFPLTHMNRSGSAVKSFLHKRISRLWQSIPTNNILIIHDDIETSLGQYHLKPSGSARGHNGIKSIHSTLGTQNIPRLMLGIGPKPETDISSFVLDTFTASEEAVIEQDLIPEAQITLTQFIKNVPSITPPTSDTFER